MKRTIAAVLLLAVLSACTSATEYGPCVGLFDDKDVKLTYKLSGWNLFMAVIGTSFLFIPTIIVAKDETFCPSGRK